MKLLIVLYAYCAIAAADVSHLSKQYLPPNAKTALEHSHMEGPTTTVIELQQLKELPEQIEYVDNVAEDNAQGSGAPVPSSNVQPPPLNIYVPPTAREQQLQQLEQPAEELVNVAAPPTPEYLPPVEATLMAAMMPTQIYLAPKATEAPQPRTPAVEYLPPNKEQLAVPQPQPNYQQYQEQMQLLQQMMPQLLEQIMQLPTALPVEPVVSTPEPEPAHMLAEDGYHYKTGSLSRRFR